MKRTIFMKMCVVTIITAMTIGLTVPAMAAGSVAVLLNEAASLKELNVSDSPNSGGWYKTAVSASNTITLSTEVTSADVQEMPDVQSGKIWGNTVKTGIQMYKQWTGSTINFGADDKYHISWKQYMPNSESYNGAWGRASYLALVRGYGAKVLETVRIGFNDAYIPKDNGNSAKSDYYPAISYNGDNSNTPNSAGSVDTIAPLTVWGDTPVEKGEFYVCDVYITTKASGNDRVEFKCYPYGESEKNALSVTKEFENGNKYQTVRFCNYGSLLQTDKQGITDLKIEKIYDSENNYESLREELAKLNLDFSNISTQSELDEAINYTAPEGMTLTWSTNDESKITVAESGPIIQDRALGKLCLTAKLEKGGIYVEKSFPVKLVKPQEPSKIILSDDLSDVEDMTSLSELGAVPERGWSTGYTSVNGNLETAMVVPTRYGRAIQMQAEMPDENTNPVVNINRQLVSEIDFDVDRTYYLTWNQMMDKYSGEYKNQRIQLLGDTLDVDGAKAANSATSIEVSPMFNTITALTESNINNNKFDEDYYPARLFVKTGSRTKSSTVGTFIAQKGRMYTFAVRIDASETGADTISIKAYPTGTPALTDWQLVEDRCAITGAADTIGFLAQPSNNDAVILYSDLKIDSMNRTDVKAYEAAEAFIKSGSKQDAVNAVNALPVNGAWKEELLKETEVKNDFVVRAVTFLQDDILKFDTGTTDSETDEKIYTEKTCNVMTTKLIQGKDVTAKVTIDNNKSIYENCILIAAIYDDEERLTDVAVSESEGIEANASTEYTLNLNGSETASAVKIFILNNLNQVQPLGNVISLDANELIQ